MLLSANKMYYSKFFGQTNKILLLRNASFYHRLKLCDLFVKNDWKNKRHKAELAVINVNSGCNVHEFLQITIESAKLCFHELELITIVLKY